MILYEWSGENLDQQNVFVPNDNLYLIFTTDKTIHATGFSLQYEIIEKGELRCTHIPSIKRNLSYFRDIYLEYGCK